MTTSADTPLTAREQIRKGNKFKLGLFGHNVSNGLSFTTAPTSYEITWPHTSAISRAADQAGIEFLIPVARWRGMGGNTDPFSESFETMTWAAGIAAETSHITVVSTLHLTLAHPVMAAKQCATIDHIAKGRYAFNAVMGWFAPDMVMFGQEMMDHDDRYRYGAEWMGLVKRIWTSKEPFDFDGEFFQLREVQSLPKPFQGPYPPILNAGGSPAGVDFAAREADYNFAIVNDLESGAQHVERAKKLARETYDREISPLTDGFLVCRETEKEARAVVDQMLEMADRPAAENFLREFGIGSGSLSEEMRELVDRGIVGLGGPQFIGTPDQVAEQLKEIHDIGVEGVVLGMLDYLEELPYFVEQVLPRLEEMGLREPFTP
ncbi:LLM class flavin-dependent oxidoreductase [Pseudonocardia abyssalis]|uniref:LLM class flavin-dependent oxidoreductase n=1 Tax=Pseudonocardia abyssalis TaxID=2792008 RepID=A0ABS6V1W4_9PSEU|nr:LLM class flavin-dependent oxidoreductase [Pseudonocardia abyssalis]MBW0114196.1 LLM class flavin-dependent oxidoreductase [Pseudonocardia abyssalis]MBW0138499.1 LLM class flavin-dependent oxidoreductase [Pseudonocardia abyssalis]